jgi:spore coat protein CotH
VTVNGEYLGLYVQIEPVKKRFLRQHFESEEGKLYEGTLSDFNGWLGTIEQKTNDDEQDPSDVEAIRDALALPADQYLAALEQVIDVDQFITFWALEVIIGHWDGYAGNRNNFYIYAEPGEKFVFLPWGVDQTFRTLTGRYNGDPQTVLARGELSFRMYNDPAVRPIYEARIRSLLDTVWDAPTQVASLNQMKDIITTHEREDYRGQILDNADEVGDFILERRTVMLGELDAGSGWNNGLPNPDNFCRP